MKKNKLAWIAASITLAMTITACDNDSEAPQPSRIITIKATHGENNATRVDFSGIDSEGFDLAWSADDSFTVLTNTFDITDTETGTFACNEYTGEEPIGQTAYYPSYTDYPASGQTQEENGGTDHLAENYAAQGEVESDGDDGYTVNFTPHAALMKFTLTLPESEAGNTFTNITLTAPDDTFLDNLGFGESNSTATISLALDDITPDDDNKITAYMLLVQSAPIPEDGTLSITLTGGDNGPYAVTATAGTSGISYTAGKIYTANIDFVDHTVAFSNIEAIGVTWDIQKPFVPGYDRTIVTEQDLIDFRDEVNAGATTLRAIQVANLDFTDEEAWTGGIGVRSGPVQFFQGTYNGNGYTITGLTVNAGSGSNSSGGLFSMIYEATLVDIHLRNVNTTGIYAGALVGWSSDSTISLCSATGQVYANTSFAGGLVGSVSDTHITLSSTNCTVTGQSNTGSIMGSGSCYIVACMAVSDLRLDGDNGSTKAYSYTTQDGGTSYNYYDISSIPIRTWNKATQQVEEWIFTADCWNGTSPYGINWDWTPAQP